MVAKGELKAPVRNVLPDAIAGDVVERGALAEILRAAADDDGQLALAMKTLAAMRSKGLATEIVATGSPRKRFDKAAKIPAHALVSVGTRDDALHINVRGDGERTKAVEAIVRAL